MTARRFAAKTLALVLALTMALPADILLAASGGTRVAHKPPGSYIPGFRINLAAQVEDSSGVLLARCYFKTQKDSTFVFADMAAAKKEYRATLPAPWLGAGTIEYLFVVVSKEKKVFRSELYRLAEKKTAQAKKWKEMGAVPEVRLDVAQEVAEKYVTLRKELVKEYRNKLPDWQERDPKGNLDIGTELKAAEVQLRGFLDQVVIREAPAYLRYGMLTEGIYTPAQIAAAGGPEAVATATGTAGPSAAGAAGAGAAGAGGAAAAGGGSNWVWWTLGGLAVAGGAAAVALSGSGGDGGGDDVRNAKPLDFVGTYDTTDPARPPSQYRAVFVFNSGGGGSVREWVNGSPIGTSALVWGFNDATDVFSFSVPGGGAASGHITGTVNDFTLSGTYSNGSPATLHMVRR